MKSSIVVASLVAAFAGPVFGADDLCREQAVAMGYVAEVEMLAPCEAKKVAAADEYRLDDRRQSVDSKFDSRSIATAGEIK